MDNFSVLPEGCISQILSMASPRDACRSSAISPLFKAAADSDGVWEKFLPSDYRQIISRSVSPVVFPTKKHLYLSLCDSPLLLDGGKLVVKPIAIPSSLATLSFLLLQSFSEVARFLLVRWLDIGGRINTAMLSANTTYAAYLIFKISDHNGLKSLLVKSYVRFVKELEYGYPDDLSCTVYLTLGTVRSLPREQIGRLPQMRRDGWMEIELGEFYNDEGDEGEVEIRLRDVRGSKIGQIVKGKLIVEGIEVRPKDIA
ncbi:hypothetical protein RHSIM_Rhsim09G0053000 [Rhododendron simsii]|uniref:F-box domain-containing protein n=1 Tax=Rhododendron simsii TaxID=118357 RepID=A0A834LFM4_RHOSS|nr:hypothetical protein RHSIM_Rhsim09G0053000 [Rhododendron simsii]